MVELGTLNRTTFLCRLASMQSDCRINPLIETRMVMSSYPTLVCPPDSTKNAMHNITNGSMIMRETLVVDQHLHKLRATASW
jgi:hypothetical protein